MKSVLRPKLPIKSNLGEGRACAGTQNVGTPDKGHPVYRPIHANIDDGIASLHLRVGKAQVSRDRSFFSPGVRFIGNKNASERWLRGGVCRRDDRSPNRTTLASGSGYLPVNSPEIEVHLPHAAPEGPGAEAPIFIPEQLQSERLITALVVLASIGYLCLFRRYTTIEPDE